MLPQLAQRGALWLVTPSRGPQAGGTLQLNLSEGTHTFKDFVLF